MIGLRAGGLAFVACFLPGVLCQDYRNPCCDAIQQNIPGTVTFPDSDNYQEEKQSYWSALAGSSNPACFVRPRTAIEVSTIMQILNQEQYDNLPGCRFAIRSGGHTTWPANNIQDGVTIDLSDLNQVTIANDRSIVSIGPGNRWARVYEALEPHGIAVSGGRWGNVGVGGLLLGGGLSFFQGARGPSCDGIMNHEIVLANGSIINANKMQNPDLHRALKGGNNNFGIVTRFDLQAFPQGQLWHAQILGQPGRQNIPINWFEQFASRRNNDPNGWTHRSFVTYSRPQEYPALFRGLVDKSIFVTQEVTTFQNVAQINAETSPSGTRSSFSTFTFINSASYMNKLLDIAEQFSKSLPGMTSINLIFQPLWTAPRTYSFKANGGNSLGLEHTNEDLVIGLLHTVWLSSANDNQVRFAERSFLANARILARQMGVYHPYLYANYAEQWQDVMSGYGPQTVELLRNVSSKYDPRSLFQRRVPGGFKLWPRQSNQNDPFAQDYPDNLPTQLQPEGYQQQQSEAYPQQPRPGIYQQPSTYPSTSADLGLNPQSAPVISQESPYYQGTQPRPIQGSSGAENTEGYTWRGTEQIEDEDL